MTLQGAIKQLHELRCNEDMPVFFKPVIAEVINVLLMDAEEVRHGKWEYVKKRLARGGYVDASECSVCHKIIMPHLKPNYCPNCGARMVDVDEVEE